MRLVGVRLAALASGATTTRWTVYATVIAQVELGLGSERGEVVSRMAAAIERLPDELVVQQLRYLATALGREHPLIARWRDAWRLRRSKKPGDQVNSPAAAGEVVADTSPADVSERRAENAPATGGSERAPATAPPLSAQAPRGRTSSPPERRERRRGSKRG